jgi:hypothetical protein
VPRDPAPPPGLREPLLAFLGATALASALFWTGRVVPFVAENLHGAIALIFLFTPAVASRASRRPFDYRAAGLRADPYRLNLAVLGAGIGLTWPLFLGAFLLFYGLVCPSGASGLRAAIAEIFAPLCLRWLGPGGAVFRLPEHFPSLALSQVVVIALPEEAFFRGYLYARLEERWPSRARLLGAPVGRALVVSSVVFGFGHVLVDFDPQRFAVIVPGLVFGWMRARTGSVAAGALFHALCNLYSDVLHTSFFR